MVNEHVLKYRQHQQQTEFGNVAADFNIFTNDRISGAIEASLSYLKEAHPGVACRVYWTVLR